jgi:predicted Zn-dependent protease
MFTQGRFFLGLVGLILACLILLSCASTRPAVPVGAVPSQNYLYAADEDYGHKVLGVLSKQYPLDRDDERISRVRNIVSTLTRAGNVDHNPWHAYVLKGDNVKNAAATRGNFLFVWTGMLRAVRNDEELATIIAHEIAHVLAGHTNPDPGEEANRIMAELAGLATKEAVLYQGGALAIWAGLAQLLVLEGVKALIVNPELQRIELEADQIGLFLMADAGYDPIQAVAFWERVQRDPSFAGAPAEFLSSHPSSATRLLRLKELLPEARLRYERALAANLPVSKNFPEPVGSPSSLPSASLLSSSDELSLPDAQDQKVWVVQQEQIVYERPFFSSTVVTRLGAGTRVKVRSLDGRWLQISEPYQGFIQSRFLSPLTEKDF